MLYNKHMNNRNSFETSFASPEQESKLNQESAWDVLVELLKTETWDEHLEKANNLLKSDDKLTTKEAKEFIDYSEVAKYNKTNHFQNLTSQEKLEREFNSELSHIDDLEMLAEANDPRVEKTSVKYHDQSIPIYILKNYPFKFLAHIINYREDDNITKFGTKTSDELVNNPKKMVRTIPTAKARRTNGRMGR